MDIVNYTNDDLKSVVELFKTTFGNSEGDEEGRVIGGLVKKMLTTTPSYEMNCFIAKQDNEFIGAVCFTPVKFSSGELAMILSPMAVATNKQNKGIGQKIINHGLAEIQKLGFDIVLTYGNPMFYKKVGFEQITEELIKAPLKLSYPTGWLAQSLKRDEIKPIKGTSTCVEALNHQRYW